MFPAILLGIASSHIFHLQRGQFSWLDLLKPVCISPILLLPLMASLQGVGDLNDMQVISFALLAFQNGFFWRVVLTSAKPAMQPSAKRTSARSGHASSAG